MNEAMQLSLLPEIERVVDPSRGLLAKYQGVWVEVLNEDRTSVNQEVIWKLTSYNRFKEMNKDTEFVTKYKDQFLVIASDRPDAGRFVTNSKSQALQLREDTGYIGLIGYDNDDLSLRTVLVLDATTTMVLGLSQKPEGFEDI